MHAQILVYTHTHTHTHTLTAHTNIHSRTFLQNELILMTRLLLSGLKRSKKSTQITVGNIPRHATIAHSLNSHKSRGPQNWLQTCTQTPRIRTKTQHTQPVNPPTMPHDHNTLTQTSGQCYTGKTYNRTRLKPAKI